MRECLRRWRSADGWHLSARRLPALILLGAAGGGCFTISLDELGQGSGGGDSAGPGPGSSGSSSSDAASSSGDGTSSTSTGLACDAGFEDCDLSPSNGCEADLSRDTTCGSCDVACASEESCDGGRCRIVCPDGASDCDDDGICEQLADDTAHCGACDHDCQGGDCVVGRCEPVLLWAMPEDAAHITGIALTDDEVVFLADDSVMMVPKTGGAPSVLTSDAGAGTRVAVDGGYAYFTMGYGGLNRIALDGSGQRELLQQGFAKGLQIDGDGVIVVFDPIDGGDPSLARVMKGGGTPWAHAMVEQRPWAVGVDDTYAYGGDDAGILRVARLTGEDAEVFPIEGGAGDRILIREGFAYVIGDAGLVAIDLETFATTTLVPDTPGGQLAHDDEHLYFGEYGTGDLKRLAWSDLDAPPVLVTESEPGIDVIALDDTTIFYSNNGQNQLWRLAK